MVKNLPAKQETEFHSWVTKIPWRRKWQPTPVSLPGKSHGWRSLAGYTAGRPRFAVFLPMGGWLTLGKLPSLSECHCPCLCKIKITVAPGFPWLGLPWWLSGKESTYQCRRFVRSLDQKDPLEKKMATHSSILAWEIPWAKEPGVL